MRTMLTTGQAAKLLGVSQQSVIRMFDLGKLTGYRLDTGKAHPFRRIDPASVHALLREWARGARIEDDLGAGI